ncbi:ribosome biogenesis GTP-binding protein YihA/YsxC [Spiroplasma endosymbiont of Aspidapion aeneum]|uniref:ribosome biogenesis GTP-binding protein YihA/YsxC n=1 Tax=Spiroplasma endosymbiont of Aspidapion aeneum TaxID=3066276 RepID=UPI00313B4824
MFIKNSVFIKSCASFDDLPKDDVKEVIFLGRSNVGKSSFINSFCNQNKLAKISQTPGKTRLLNLFSINNNLFRLVDSPGYGYAKIAVSLKDSFLKLMDDYLKESSNLKLCCLLLDMRRTPNQGDIDLYNFLKYYKKSVLIIGTKEDKLKRNDIIKQTKIIKSAIGFNEDDKFIITSSLNKLNIIKVQEYILNFLATC